MPGQTEAHSRRDILLRTLAAAIGGYGFASACTVLLSAVLPLPRAEAVLAATLCSFALYAAAAIWSFSAPTLSRVWLGLALPSIMFATVGLLLARLP